MGIKRAIQSSVFKNRAAYTVKNGTDPALTSRVNLIYGLQGGTFNMHTGHEGAQYNTSANIYGNHRSSNKTGSTQLHGRVNPKTHRAKQADDETHKPEF